MKGQLIPRVLNTHPSWSPQSETGHSNLGTLLSQFLPPFLSRESSRAEATYLSLNRVFLGRGVWGNQQGCTHKVLRIKITYLNLYLKRRMFYWLRGTADSQAESQKQVARVCTPTLSLAGLPITLLKHVHPSSRQNEMLGEA